MSTITRQQFTQEFKSGITIDDALVARLNKAGVDGKALLASVDKDKTGRIEGAELEALWKKLDDLDKDGSRGTISDTKPLAVVDALRSAPTMAPIAPTGPAPVGTLKRGAKGPEVQAAQEKLMKLGFELGPKGADGELGGGTMKAVKEFQAQHKLKQTGELDPATLSALSAAKPAYPEYDKMWADGVLQTTIGVGFDEAGNDVGVRQEIVTGLTERGFKQMNLAKMSDEELTKAGFDLTKFDRKTLDPNATYYVKLTPHGGKMMPVVVRLVDRNTPDAKEQFSKGMKGDDLVIYSGHGRVGSGPDFDDKHSANGNYVIGDPMEANYVTIGKNDIDKKGALSDGYQLMFFDACNTKWYVDDLRKRPKNKDEDNLDIVASNRELPWPQSAPDVFGMLDGVLAEKSMPDIKRDIEANHGSGPPAFRTDGFKGNTYQPASSP